MVDEDFSGLPHGIVGGSRAYDGPRLGEGPWRCPACAAQNTGPLDEGCTTCGSGSARGRHVDDPPPVTKLDDLRLDRSAAFTAVKGDLQAGLDVHMAAVAWAAAHEESPLSDAFLAGYQFALQRTMKAPPVSVDTTALAPEGKARRTIIAALELFKDQVLREARDEIASGEWLTIEETEQLLQQLRDEEEEERAT